ncbi:DNA polymerase III delta subunit [Litorimonas taeanensis]|uniref:DNA-directed DNA polymerase n=1 Tax=Litorimonas taeanensis TaxID=568099 RepID=A0A420WEP6_9PROT|nr:DNA polymerase III subunit delta [Litorimonas taeanensis]RKQ69446.1 DNA polymerase III delta subunit [Litorimonas taeanensis]
MKLTGARATRFIEKPSADVIGVLLFGPDRGLVKARSLALSKVFMPNADDAFGTTILTADDLSGDPARLADEMSALSLLGDDRLVRLRLDHERNGAAISKLIKQFDTEPEKAEAKLIIEAGDMTPRSAIRKACEASAHFAAIGCYAASARDIAELAKSKLAEHNISLMPDALDLWVPLLEGDHALALGEIEKMALYKGYGKFEGASVTVADIRAIAAGGQSASIDMIVMQTLSGAIEEADASYRRAMAGKLNPVGILIGLQRHLLRLIEASMAMDGGNNVGQAMRSLRPPVFSMQEDMFKRHLSLWPQSMLRRALTQSQKAEREIKTAAAPAEAIMGRLILALASYAAKRT